jgi:hypothetical protein
MADQGDGGDWARMIVIDVIASEAKQSSFSSPFVLLAMTASISE